MLDIHEDGFLFPHALASKQPALTRIVSPCFRTLTPRILTQASFLLAVPQLRLPNRHPITLDTNCPQRLLTHL